MMKISIVVPVFNEAENIFPLLEDIESAMTNAQACEIIYVDDGSNDETPAILRLALQEFEGLRVIRHRQSYGQSAAIRTGVMQAQYPIIATLDGDGQNDPDDIPRLYENLFKLRQRTPDLWMIAGWRKERQDSWWRIFSSKVANVVRMALLKDDTPDTGCGLKVFLRDKFLELPYFDHMHRYLPALVIRAGGKVISAQVKHRPRQRGVSKYDTLGRLWVGIIDLMGVIWLIRRSSRIDAEEINRG